MQLCTCDHPDLYTPPTCETPVCRLCGCWRLDEVAVATSANHGNPMVLQLDPVEEPPKRTMPPSPRGPLRFRHQQAKPRLNDPCPCGSGRKYKRCHWDGGRQWR